MDEKKIKLLIIIPYYPFGGSERVLFNIYSNINLELFNPRIVVIAKNTLDQTLINSMLGNNGYVLVGRIRNVALSIIKIIRQTKSHFVISSDHSVSILLGCFKFMKMFKAKLIFRFPTAPQYPLMGKSRFYKSIDYVLTKLAYSTASYVVFLTARQSDYFSCYYGVFFSNKTGIIKNPIDFDNILKMAESIENPYGERNLNIVSVGRFKEAKRFDILLLAFNEFVKEFPFAKLYLVGGGVLESELKSIVSNLELDNSVYFVNYSENPYPYMLNADLYVSSSEFEGSPNSLIEASYLSRKVVATDCFTGARELLGDDFPGLVEVNDYMALANKMKIVIFDQTSKTIDLSEYELNNVLKRYENLMVSLYE